MIVMRSCKSQSMPRRIGATLMLAAVAIAPGCGQANTAGAAAVATTTATRSSAAVSADATPEQLQRERTNAKVRIRQDVRRFPREQLNEADQLYQAAIKDWRSNEARQGVKALVQKFPELNRTGCALLYVGQMSAGQEREDYLKQAIAHSDSYFGDGVQVGAYARYLLGHHYRDQGKSVEAERFFDEVRQSYPNAITHSGKLLVAVMREEGKEMKAEPVTTQEAAE